MIVRTKRSDPGLDDDIGFGVRILNQATRGNDLLPQRTGDVLAVDEVFTFDVTQVARIQINLASAHGSKIDHRDTAIDRIAHHQLLGRVVFASGTATNQAGNHQRSEQHGDRLLIKRPDGISIKEPRGRQFSGQIHCVDTEK